MDDLIHGHCDARFGRVRAALADNIASGEEVGACLTDGAPTSAWTRDTIVNVWSSTKTVTSLAALNGSTAAWPG